jgi:spermidine synthase
MKLLEIPAPFPLQDSRVLLLEPPGNCGPELGRQLWDGTYDKPFILDQGALRFLHFDLQHVQSLMRRDDPDELCLRYTRKMMTFLLFMPQPRRILIVGLGGGSLAKFCYRRLPSATITALEVDPWIIALRKEFGVPPNDKRFRVVQGDGGEYVARRGLRQDVILLDAYDRQGVAPGLDTPSFYRKALHRLTPGGVLVVNIHGDPYERASHFANIRRVFGKRVIVLPVRDNHNLIVLAFRNNAVVRNWAGRERRAVMLERRFGLNFPRYLHRMLRSPVITPLHPLM